MFILFFCGKSIWYCRTKTTTTKKIYIYKHNGKIKLGWCWLCWIYSIRFDPAVHASRRKHLKQTTHLENMADRTGRASFVLYKTDIYNSSLNAFTSCYRWCVPTQRDRAALLQSSCFWISGIERVWWPERVRWMMIMMWTFLRMKNNHYLLVTACILLVFNVVRTPRQLTCIFGFVYDHVTLWFCMK